VPPSTVSADELFQTYDNTLRSIADQLAPERTVKCALQLLCPWFDAECRATRRNCRRLERRYRRTRDPADKAAYVATSRDKHNTIDQKKKSCWSQHVQTDGSSPTKLWRSLTTLLQRDKRMADAITPTCNDADDFLCFFDEKVKAVRMSTEGQQLPTSTTPPADVSLSALSPCSEEEVCRFIMQSPTKSCTLDPILAFLVKEMVDVLLPYVTAMINTSLCEGRLPSSHKHAVVTSLLKKPGLDAEELKNYRPSLQLDIRVKVGGEWSHHGSSITLPPHTVRCHSYSPHIDVITALRQHC